uniref:Uncharacterized protein n=1 Tax=Meloidogyne enterolobii TaxID=390850 RepID=A0A6V7VQQ3_MELEN|nr:unnamed protein product [Meloidogyne enterolobii]
MALDQVSDSDSFLSETDYDNPLQKFKQTATRTDYFKYSTTTNFFKSTTTKFFK